MKVLIISHNPVSSQSNMGKTLLSLFSGFRPEELCQLYIYPTVPNGKACGAYYRITDREALTSPLGLRRIGAEIPEASIGPHQGLFEDPADAALYRSRKNKSALRALLRDAMWRVSGWYGPGLREWLDRERPDCIFAAPGAAKFLYYFVLTIARNRGIPVVTYLCDEFYFVKEPQRGLDRLRLKLLRRKMEALLAASAHLVVISGELKAAYASFGVETTVLMTGSAFPAAKRTAAEAPWEIRYFGNVRCNRYLSLIQVGEALEALNREKGTAWRLAVYTAEQDGEILSALRSCPGLELRSFVSGRAFDEALRSAPLLLHVEAFDPESRDRVKHSVSTKIADSLATGIPLLAYGPAEIASMAHLARNDCAILATSQAQLRDMLLTAFTDENARRRAAENGLKTAAEYHDSARTSGRLREIYESITGQ